MSQYIYEVDFGTFPVIGALIRLGDVGKGSTPVSSKDLALELYPDDMRRYHRITYQVSRERSAIRLMGYDPLVVLENVQGPGSQPARYRFNPPTRSVPE